MARWLVEQGQVRVRGGEHVRVQRRDVVARRAPRRSATSAKRKALFRKAKLPRDPRPPANSDELANSVPPTAAYVARLAREFPADQRERTQRRAQSRAARPARNVRVPARAQVAPRTRRAERSRRERKRKRKRKKRSPRARAPSTRTTRRDDEGFRPSDLARLAGDAKLHAWLAAEEKAHDEEEADAETRGGLAEETRARGRDDAYARYPPTTFYGAASLGDARCSRGCFVRTCTN